MYIKYIFKKVGINMDNKTAFSAFIIALPGLCHAPEEQKLWYIFIEDGGKVTAALYQLQWERLYFLALTKQLSELLWFLHHLVNKLFLCPFLTSISSCSASISLKSAPLCQVRQLQESAAQLRTVYAGEKAEAIACREQEVMQYWKELLTSCEECRLQITTETDKLRFFGMVRDQIMWMDSIICQIGTGEKPR